MKQKIYDGLTGASGIAAIEMLPDIPDDVPVLTWIKLLFEIGTQAAIAYFTIKRLIRNDKNSKSEIEKKSQDN